MSALVQLVRSCFPSIAEMLYYHKAFGKLQMSYDTSWYGIPTFNLNFMNHHVGVSTQIYQGVFWKSPAFTSTSNSMQIHSSTMEDLKEIRRLVEKYHLPLEVFPAPIIWLRIGWRHLRKIDKQQSHCILDLNPVSQVFPPLWASFPHHKQVTLDPQWLPNLVGQESKNWQHGHCHRKVSRDT